VPDIAIQMRHQVGYDAVVVEQGVVHVEQEHDRLRSHPGNLRCGEPGAMRPRPD